MSAALSRRVLPVALSLLVAFVCSTCVADFPPYQKGYPAQKGHGKSHEHCSHCERNHHCLPPPDAPLFQSVATLRVRIPDRRVRIRTEEESGIVPESAIESEDSSESMKELEERLARLAKQFDSLFNSVGKLVERLKPQP